MMKLRRKSQLLITLAQWVIRLIFAPQIKYMKFYNTIIKYRFWLSLLALVAAAGVNYSSGFWPAFILYFVGVIGLASHFFIGPLRLIQEPMERGDMEEVERILNTNKLQLGMMSMQRGDLKQGESYIRAAIRAGIADKESEAVAYISMCQIFMNKREFRAAKDYFRRAKACKPTTKQVVDQIKEVEKYISRMPG